MSRSRRDSHNAKLRRDRIQREKHVHAVGLPPERSVFDRPAHPFASERTLRELHAWMEGREFGSIEEANTALAEMNESGRLSEIAQAWKSDDPKWRAQELAYDALEADSLEEVVRLTSEAIKLDPECTDAQRLQVSVVPMSPENRLHLMREVVERAERNLGQDSFEEHMGHFWGTIATRPYMRALQHLAELLRDTGRKEEAIETYERMLELNPNDNQGVRTPLLALYLAEDQRAGASSVLARYPDEEKYMGSFAWARALLLWLDEDLEAAEKAMAAARKVNPFLEPYITGTCTIPEEVPEYFRPGKESEAQTSAKELAAAWRRHPGFGQWVRGRRSGPASVT